MEEGKGNGRFFFLPPRAWHAVAALRLVAERGVFMSFCCAADCEGLRVLGVFSRRRFTSVRSVQ